ncbi:tetratricopeptide repeat protein [Nocardia sp. NPDC052112]|uniref:tetratricopeptide repeat protein n=1 Tax=Nocardia sp. NPDC052112 TaxID=3155646 RepID=UPI003431F2ED
MPEFEALDHAQQVNVAGDNIGTINTAQHYHEAAPPPQEPITSSLPAAPRAFVGRDQELQQILAAADHEHVISIYAIDGMAGVGKTALAVCAAHELAARFPDGQYFIELHAHTSEQKAADPSEVLAGLLIELGMDPRSIPDTLTGRRDLWRNRLADKKALVVLDDAADRDHVEPLLPSGPGCLTLVTSRHRLRVVPGTRPLALKVLDRDPAADLFLSVADRDPASDGERDVAQRIVELCGWLPLAIVLVAGRLAHHPHWTTAEITELAEEFEAATDRLTELDANDRIVRAAFDLSYRDLPPARQLLFRRLGLHPGSDVDAYAVAALAGTDLATAERELDAVYTDHLLDEPARGRYRLHDLLRDYAHTLTDDDPIIDNTRAMDRLLDYYQHTATYADRWLARRTRPTGDRDITIPTAASGGVVVREFGDQLRALAWMRVERINLLACLEHTASGDPARMIALTAVLAALLDRDGPWPLAGRVHHRAAETAQRLHDRLGEATALTDLGIVCWLTDDYGRSADLLQQALTLYRDLGNRLGEANALDSLGFVRRLTGDYEQAADLYGQALTRYRDLGDRLGEANALNDLGLVHRYTGDYGQAADLQQQALTRYRDLGDRLGEANALTDLGLVRRDTGDYGLAADLLQQALTRYRDLDNRLGEASALNYLGFVRREVGDYGQAADLHQQALTRYRDLGNRLGQATALTDLGLVRREVGDYEQAADLHQQALTIYRDLGNRRGEANALTALGYARREIGDYEQAADLYRQALTLHRDLGSRHGQADTLGNLGTLHERTGEHQLAAHLHQRALTLYRDIGFRLGQAEELNGIGRVLLATGEPGDALTAFTDAIGLAREIGNHLEQARALEGAARCRAGLGDVPAAVTDLSAAVEIYRRLGVPETEPAAVYLAELESRRPRG